MRLVRRRANWTATPRKLSVIERANYTSNRNNYILLWMGALLRHHEKQGGNPEGGFSFASNSAESGRGKKATDERLLKLEIPLLY